MTNRRNIAARLGGWSIRHRMLAILAWSLFVVIASLAGSVLGQVNLTDAQEGAGDSAAAAQILANAGHAQPAAEMVLVHSYTAATNTSSFHRAVQTVLADVQHTGLIQGLQDPLAEGLTSRDGHSALVEFNITGNPDTAGSRIQPVLDAVARAQAASPGFTMKEFGDASGVQAIDNTLGSNFTRAEWTAVPVALGILLVAFGALVAAVVPVLLALTAFLGALGLLDVISHLVHLNNFTTAVMLVMGLAVGVDYSLFYLRRVRQERAAGRSPGEALAIAAATSGRSVLISGVIVMAGMAGMFFSGMNIFDGFALAVILVVFVAMLGSVTVLPAVLSLLGDKVVALRVPFIAKRRQQLPGGGRFWNAVISKVMARPWIFALVSAAAMLTLAAPALYMHTEALSIEQLLPHNSPLVATGQQIDSEFPGAAAPVQVVVKAPDIRAPQVSQEIAAFERAALASGDIRQPVQVQIFSSSNVAEISAPLPGDGSDTTSQQAVTALRQHVVPSTLARVPGTQALVGGDLAYSMDYSAQLKHSIVPVFAFVIVVAFLLLLIALRSVTIACTAIVLDLLSVGAAYGVMTAVFQYGWGASLVGTHAVGAIESWMPLLVFVILFGLSTDYHVFVVSRIREARDAGVPTARAISLGIRGTAGAVTSAAFIMVAVFAVVGTLSMQDFKQLGVGLAAAILLDATVIRVLLLPSVMALLGRANWYLPRWLAWLPSIDHGGPAAQPDDAPAITEAPPALSPARSTPKRP
ncbi:MAG TPA: MMPL family transporter [Streptosporangiaceae bacterium]|nr:MMPL family transporter [Streptosporangiaceae bacterium]